MKFLKFDDEYFRQMGLMFIGIGLFNLFNLLYHFFMVRALSPIDYGHLNTLLALFMVISVPANTVQTTITKFVSSLQAQNKFDKVRPLLLHLLSLMSMVAVSICLLITLGSPFISSFLQISSKGLIFLLGISLLFAMVIPVPWGGLQGLQKFGPLAFNLIVNGGLKLALGIFFVNFGLGALGAMGAIALSYFIAIFLSFFILRGYLPKAKGVSLKEANSEMFNPFNMSEVYHYFFPVGITLLCFSVLTSVDLILVKHFFTPLEAGYYSIAQMVGKIILFLPLPIIMVMFPKLTSMGSQVEKKRIILQKSLYLSGLCCSAMVLVCILFPSFIIEILTGKVHSECIPLIKYFSLNMTFFSLTLIALYYHLSTDEKGFLYPLSFFTVIQIGFILIFHQSLTQVLFVVGMVALCLLGVNFYLVYHSMRKRVGRSWD